MKIYEPKGRAREYSPLALNYFNGCSHNCKYCYVPGIMKRFNDSYCHENVSVNVDYSELEKSAKKYQGYGKQILLSFTGDPYCGYYPEVTTEVLNILLKYNHLVAILTKGGKRCLNDLNLFKKFGQNIKVGSTLTFDNEKDSLEWESGAALPDERIETLKLLHENGVKTWCSFEPVIDPLQSLRLLEKVSSFVDHVKIGKINNYNGIDKSIDWERFIEHSVHICRKNNLSFYIKKDLLEFNKKVKLNSSESDMDFLSLKPVYIDLFTDI